MTLLWAAGIVLAAAVATIVATAVVETVLLIVNPRFSDHLDRYVWLQMLLGVLMTLAFALSYVWLVARSGRTLASRWMLAAIAVVGAALIEPVELPWSFLGATLMVVIVLTFIAALRAFAGPEMPRAVIYNLASWGMVAVVLVGIVVAFLPRATGFCASHDCIPSFANGTGFIVQCADGKWSQSGGRPGACSYHGGVR